MDEINQTNQRIITLFPDRTTDGEECWAATVPSCLGLMAQDDTPAEALKALAEFWRDYERQYESFGESLPPELYRLVERGLIIKHLFATLFKHEDMYYLGLKLPGNLEVLVAPHLTAAFWRLGRVGWQLVSVIQDSMGHVYWLSFPYSDHSEIYTMLWKLTGDEEILSQLAHVNE